MKARILIIEGDGADAIRAVARALMNYIDPVAKASKGKTAAAGAANGGRKTKMSTRADGDVSRLRAGRTAQDRPQPTKVGSVAIQKRGRGRPKVTGPRPWEAEGISRRTWYRRQKEQK